MIELEKVVRGLECCCEQNGGPELCEQCPYTNEPFPCGNAIMRDALALLKAQVPRVMTLEEVVESEDWMWREYTSGYCEWCRQIDVCKLDNSIVWNDGYIETLDDYAERWRCWTSRPSPELMANTPWEVGE